MNLLAFMPIVLNQVIAVVAFQVNIPGVFLDNM